MDDHLDPESIFAALSNDADFAGDNLPTTLEVYGRLARELPRVLADLLDEPLTYRSLMLAKIAVMRHFLEEGYPEDVADAIPDYLLGYTRPEIVSTTYRLMPRHIRTFKRIAEDPLAWLAALGASEAAMLEASDGGRLNAAAMAAYRAGTLTVGRLIGIQPSVFIKNNSDQ